MKARHAVALSFFALLAACAADPSTNGLPDPIMADGMDADTRMSVSFADAPVEAALDEYATISGLILLVAPHLPRAAVTVDSDGELTRRECLALLRETLSRHGIHVTAFGANMARVRCGYPGKGKGPAGWASPAAPPLPSARPEPLHLNEAGLGETLAKYEAKTGIVVRRALRMDDVRVSIGIDNVQTVHEYLLLIEVLLESKGVFLVPLVDRSVAAVSAKSLGFPPFGRYGVRRTVFPGSVGDPVKELRARPIPPVRPRPVTYAERLRQRREAIQQRHVQPPEVKPNREQLKKYLQEYQMDLIRKGNAPLPMPLTPEMDAQLVEEGVLPPLEEEDRTTREP